MCFDNGGEYSDVWDERIVRARKLHGCDDCSDGIRPGEWYQRIGSLYEGCWSTLRVCARCHWDRWIIVYAAERKENCEHHESICPIGYLDEYMDNMHNQARGWGDPEDLPTGWERSPITYRAAA